jgi:hypothetical protein
LLKAHEGLEDRLFGFPDGVFSGKAHPKAGTKAVFFCYARPGFDKEASAESGGDVWNAQSGDVKWYLYDLASEAIIEEAPQIIDVIRSEPKTSRKTEMEQKSLSDIRQAIEKHITKTYLRKVQAPVGVKPVLKAWMELN